MHSFLPRAVHVLGCADLLQCTFLIKFVLKTALQTIEEKGNRAVRRLRRQKLANGHPFMINTRELVGYQCYLEYPDGSIHLVELKPPTDQFIILQVLTSAEANQLRKKYHLQD